MMPRDTARQLLLDLFGTGLAAADPDQLVKRHLPQPPKGRTVVVGAGKASANMARALEQAWEGPIEGLVVTRYGHAAPCEHIRIVEAAHPVPDQAGRAAAAEILELARSLTGDDLLIALISGGGSSLLSLPMPGISLEDKQDVNRQLLACGAAIDEMNVLRRHLSAIKGGRLAAAACPARCHSLLISDVPGDDPATIASGPTVGDISTLEDARAVVTRYGLSLPAHVQACLDDLASETPAPGDPMLAHSTHAMIATPRSMLEAVAAHARSQGLNTLILGDALEGEARDVGIVHAGIARSVLEHGDPVQRPCLILSGGEATVTLGRQQGRGGRNTEFLLSLAVALGPAEHVYALACDSDGIDGSEDNAGAMIDPDSLGRMRKAGLSPQGCLDSHLSFDAFRTSGDLVTTGPTLTNVNDLRMILIT